MARSYYRIVGTSAGEYHYDSIRKQPYSAIWEKNDYKLPLFISNTTRAEDGMRGFAHPLKNIDLSPGMIDLTFNGAGVLSFPDAAFLANRFPIMSPAGRIEGKGHFVDAGNSDNSDNSGISTIMHFLRYMELGSQDTTATGKTYARFLAHPVVLIGVRNDLTRFVRDQFYEEKDALNRNFTRSELSANSNAAINSGLTGVASSWDDYLKAEAPRGRIIIDHFFPIDLPFRLEVNEVHAALGGELALDTIGARVNEINVQIDSALQCARGTKCFAVAPPLGRLMAEPSLTYMRRMVAHPDNAAVYDSLLKYRDSIALKIVQRKQIR